MGICKCPKRRVTNQYCFTHRVNVCEYCMVTNHPRCIVQSYIYWLEDSDYNPVCEICTKILGEEECIRLTCYHVFHWSCVESYYCSLPSNTAPAGYQCKTCKQPVFPAPNLVSPVADVLREKLAGVNWARAGLGLPLLPEENISKVYVDAVDSTHLDVNNYHKAVDSFGSSDGIIPHRGAPVGASDDESAQFNQNGVPYSIVQMQDDSSYEPSSYSNMKENHQANKNMRRHFDSVDQPRVAAAGFDYDDDKYKRKSAAERVFRWLKNVSPPSRARRTGGHLYKRYWMAIILFCVALVTVLFLMGKMARTSADNDPSLKIMNNPHIRTNDVDVDVDPSK